MGRGPGYDRKINRIRKLHPGRNRSENVFCCKRPTLNFYLEDFLSCQHHRESLFNNTRFQCSTVTNLLRIRNKPRRYAITGRRSKRLFLTSSSNLSIQLKFKSKSQMYVYEILSNQGVDEKFRYPLYFELGRDFVINRQPIVN